MIDELYYLWLNHGLIASFKENLLIQSAGGVVELYDRWDKIKSSELVKKLKISSDKLDILTRFRDNNYLERKADEYFRKGIRIISSVSKEYPKLLSTVDNPPNLLYLKGNSEHLSKPCVAIVGTRHCTAYGQTVAKRLAKDLVDCGIVVVSGLATGIDAYAHTSTLDNNGATIAVLGGGFDFITPSTNIALSKQIEAHGLLVSEYAPNIQAREYTFIARNRIIAGISKGVIVVEAAHKSGALITANDCLEQGKMVFSVPGSITSPQSNGCHQLIKDGASLCTDGFMVATELGIAKKQMQTKKTALELDIFEDAVYTILKSGKTDFDTLVEKTASRARELMVLLATMELKQLIVKLPNNYYEIS